MAQFRETLNQTVEATGGPSAGLAEFAEEGRFDQAPEWQKEIS